MAESSRELFVGIDLGGTKILAALVSRQGEVIAEAKAKTKAQRGPDGVIQRIAQTVRLAMEQASVTSEAIAAVGIGAPGPVDPQAGVVHNPPNLPGWQAVPLARKLAETLDIPVYLENDVNLGTLGEHSYGAGQGTRNMIGIFPGTGVGGGLILDGRLHTGCRNAAGEIGHMIVFADGPVCGCGRRGCLEAVASRTAIEHDIHLGIAAGRDCMMPELSGSTNGRITSTVLAKAFRKRDPLVIEIIGRAQWYLGLMTASLVNLIDPEMIVFGGGLVEAVGEAFLDPIRTTARQYYIQQTAAETIEIVPARLGDYAVVLGASLLPRLANE